MEKQLQPQEWSDISVSFNTVKTRIDEQINNFELNSSNSGLELNATVNEAVDADSVLSVLCWFPEFQENEEESLLSVSDLVSEVDWLQETQNTDCSPRQLTRWEETRSWLVFRYLKSIIAFVPKPSEDWKHLSNWEQDLEWRRAGIEDPFGSEITLGCFVPDSLASQETTEAVLESQSALEEPPEVFVRKEILSNAMLNEPLIDVETAKSSSSFFESLVYDDTRDEERPAAAEFLLSRYDKLVALGQRSCAGQPGITSEEPLEHEHSTIPSALRETSKVSSPILEANLLPDVRCGTLDKSFGSSANIGLTVAPLSEKPKKSKRSKSLKAQQKSASKVDRCSSEASSKPKSKKRIRLDSMPNVKSASKVDQTGSDASGKPKSKKAIRLDSTPNVAHGKSADAERSDRHTIDRAPTVKRSTELRGKSRKNIKDVASSVGSLESQGSSWPERSPDRDSQLIYSVDSSPSPRQIAADGSRKQQEDLDTSLEVDIRHIMQHKIESEGWFRDDAENVPKKKKKKRSAKSNTNIVKIVRRAIRMEMKHVPPRCTAEKAVQAGPGVITPVRVHRRRTESVKNTTHSSMLEVVGTIHTSNKTLPFEEAPSRKKRRRSNGSLRVVKEAQGD